MFKRRSNPKQDQPHKIQGVWFLQKNEDILSKHHPGSYTKPVVQCIRKLSDASLKSCKSPRKNIEYFHGKSNICCFMSFVLMDLPYKSAALEPYISSDTVGFHHGAHHRGYVNNLNGLLEKHPEWKGASLEEIILSSHLKNDAVFNNAAQIWNHNFYWNSLQPEGGILNAGPLEQALIQTFGSFEAFADEFQKTAVSQFGSGWCWLVRRQNGSLGIRKTKDAELPLLFQEQALLVVDVWEHAYYLDYQNRRADHVKNILEHLISWTFAEKLFSATRVG